MELETKQMTDDHWRLMIHSTSLEAHMSEEPLGNFWRRWDMSLIFKYIVTVAKEGGRKKDLQTGL